MADFFWQFICYSFLGFIIEVLFTHAISNPKRDRKCFFFLPLCPVYGFGALLITALPAAIQARPLLLVPCAAVAATVAEYVMGLVYEKTMRVAFWDYSALPMNLGGKVCLLFTAFWGLLGLGLVYGVHPLVVSFIAGIPTWLTAPALLFVGLDTVITVYVLRRYGTTEALRWYLRVGHPVRT